MEKKINRGVIRTGETDIKVHLIDSFPNHPYHVFDDEDMTELAASIEANGLLNPIIVRSKADGRYELISGHRRKRAYEILKINKIRAIIVEVSDDEAIIMMVDSNCQRSKILPSEKAFSYKMKLDAIKRQGKRNDLTSTQVVSKLRSNEELGKEVNESRETIRRFIRLTNLIPELLDFVDKGRMKMQPAVELSYLDEESQRDLVDIIDGTEVFPSFSQTVRMRKAFKDGELTYELVEKMARFLCELPGVTPELSKRMLAYFHNLSEIIEKKPERLTEIKGVTKEKAMQIHNAFMQKKQERSLEVFLKKYGFKSDDIKKISSAYGASALSVIKANPYQLCDDKLVSFKICDKIGLDLNFAPDDNRRLKTAMNYVLCVKAASKGHTYLTGQMLVEETNEFFRDNAVIKTAFSNELLESRSSWQ